MKFLMKALQSFFDWLNAVYTLIIAPVSILAVTIAHMKFIIDTPTPTVWHFLVEGLAVYMSVLGVRGAINFYNERQESEE